LTQDVCSRALRTGSWLTAELADPSAAPECCIVGAKGQPLPPRTASLVAFQTSSVEHPDWVIETAANSPLQVSVP